jgi:RNA polymerase sigma-70 factor (ECF subfamily)
MMDDDDSPEPAVAIDDDRLRLIFTCCHPALAMENRVALTLRMVGGLTVAEIARAFLLQEDTMGRRITRAKAKIKAARIPYRVPSADDLPGRVSGVLAVLFFHESFNGTKGVSLALAVWGFVSYFYGEIHTHAQQSNEPPNIGQLDL